ncbi:MAG: DUF3887 domain-containing protein [Austwickia sp.]|nr:DUF3887 domain-containing protein [Actinomycetota bacterium]MCO5307807.1 DUF3887 domain-containing protein [Austwickia sp.]
MSRRLRAVAPSDPPPDAPPSGPSNGPSSRASSRASSADGHGESLYAVAAAHRAAERAEASLAAAVYQARRDGHTWQDIGAELGISRQAAFKRFGHPVDPETGEELSLQSSIPVLAQAEEAIGLLAAGDPDAVRARMSYTCARAITRRALVTVWREVLASVGALESCAGHVVLETDGAVRRTQPATPGEATAVPAIGRLVLHHEAGEMVARVSFDRHGRVNGLLIGPPEAEPAWPF